MSTASDRTPVFPASVSVWCMRAFAPAALAGAVIATVAPLTFVRVLGLVAFVAGTLGWLLHAQLLRRDHPREWNGWSAPYRTRFARLGARSIREQPSSPPAHGGGPHGFARFAPVMAQEN